MRDRSREDETSILAAYAVPIAALTALGCSDPSPPRPVETPASARGVSAAPSARPTPSTAADPSVAPAASTAPEYSARPPSFEGSPESFAAKMTGTIDCAPGKRCNAGKEVCVVAPDPDFKPRCEPISSWSQHRTPNPKGGAPNMAGITACESSSNCPAGAVCCLHEIGMADVQALVCHASLDECRDAVEVCTGRASGECRTPGTTCVQMECKAT